MARFYGHVKGSRGPAQRLGGASSGLTTIAASGSGGVEVELFVKQDGPHKDEDWCRINLIKWHGGGKDKCLYVGPVSGIRRVGLTAAGKVAHHASRRR